MVVLKQNYIKMGQKVSTCSDRTIDYNETSMRNLLVTIFAQNWVLSRSPKLYCFSGFIRSRLVGLHLRQSLNLHFTALRVRSFVIGQN